MTIVIPTVEAHLANVNVASELDSGRIMHDVEMSHNLRVSKAFKQAIMRASIVTTTNQDSLHCVFELSIKVSALRR
jgi:hypothetical protein